MEASSPLDLFPDGLLTTLLSTAATPEEQQEQQQHQRQQQQQQQYLYGTFPLVCKRFNRLSPSCSSITVGRLEGDELEQYKHWLAKHGCKVQQLTIPKGLLQHSDISTYLPNVQRLQVLNGASVPLDDISLLPALTGLTALEFSCTLSARMGMVQLLSALQPLTLEELCMPSSYDPSAYREDGLNTLATSLRQLTRLEIHQIAELKALRPLTKLQHLQSLTPPQQAILPHELEYITPLTAVCFLSIHVLHQHTAGLEQWLDGGGGPQLTKLDLMLSCKAEYVSQKLLHRLARLQ